MTNLQARRKQAVETENSRQQKKHNGIKTVVVGLRMSQEIYDALVEARNNSVGEFGGGMPLSGFILEGVIDSKLRAR